MHLSLPPSTNSSLEHFICNTGISGINGREVSFCYWRPCTHRHTCIWRSVYASLANASTQQFDEIRPGDVVTFRNAKFAGHKGTMHAKYATEAGRPGHDHVGIVIDWDGTKKKIRVWEQDREEAKGGKKDGGKVHEESYKVGDLKSGEVRVYRVMGRSWVG